MPHLVNISTKKNCANVKKAYNEHDSVTPWSIQNIVDNKRPTTKLDPEGKAREV